MEFRIADTFTDSLGRLSGDEQKAVKTTAFDMQIDPSRPGLQFHRLDRARDKNFWSVRVSSDVRIIVHRTQNSLLLCYVDHHDPAYRWARQRRLETHPRTGAAQLVEVRETVKEIEVPVYVQVKKTRPLPFANISDEELLNYGVPAEWLPDVRRADDNSLLDLADHLPDEAAEALLELATGGTPPLPSHTPPQIDPFEHPDARRRFRVMHDLEELERALDYPWEKWVVFLHPAQRELVERAYSGPARVSGSAGTGKTIVALHRAVHLARTNPDARVLLTTFSETLANALRSKLRILISSQPRLGERVEVYAIDALAERLYRLNLGAFTLASSEQIGERIEEAAAASGESKFSTRLHADGVGAGRRCLAIGHVGCLSRRTPSRPPPQSARNATRGALDHIRERASGSEGRRADHPRPDVRPAGPPVHRNAAVAVRFCHRRRVPGRRRITTALSACPGTDKPDGLFFTGDLGQRIFQQPFSWRALGIEIRGRARTLKVNYRTSHQIRKRSDLLLGPDIADVDGNTEQRAGTISVFNGAEPAIVVSDSVEEELESIAGWLTKLTDRGLAADEISLFVRSADQIGRATAAVEKAGLPFTILDNHVQTTAEHVSVSTMHLAKGLEFRAVAVIACDDEVVPLQERIETVTDDTDLEDVYNTERHLLYVACTRARDHLLVSGVKPASEFLDDLLMNGS